MLDRKRVKRLGEGRIRKTQLGGRCHTTSYYAHEKLPCLYAGIVQTPACHVLASLVTLYLVRMDQVIVHAPCMGIRWQWCRKNAHFLASRWEDC